jgi:type VI secretion system protein ImpB
MPKKESTQEKITRIRPPRVHITYNVELDGAMELKEIPFVLGVMGDYSGKPEEPLPRLKERKFIEIDRDNFDSVLAGMNPRLQLGVENKLTNDGSKLGVELKFNRMEDFEPDQVVQQVEPLRRLVQDRQRLSDLLSKMDGNDKLESGLEEILKNAEKQQQLGSQLGIDSEKGKDAPKKEESK